MFLTRLYELRQNSRIRRCEDGRFALQRTPPPCSRTATVLNTAGYQLLSGFTKPRSGLKKQALQ